MDLLNRFTDFSDGMKQHRSVFHSVTRLVGQGTEIVTHRAEIRHQRRQIGIHLHQQPFRLGYRVAKPDQHRDEKADKDRKRRGTKAGGKFH
jgi:hypothetical protein